MPTPPSRNFQLRAIKQQQHIFSSTLTMKTANHLSVVLGAIHGVKTIEDSSFFQSAKGPAKFAFMAGKEYAEQVRLKT